MSLLLRGLARLIGGLWMSAIALAGLGVALNCLDAVINLGQIRPDRLLHLRTVSNNVGDFLARVAKPGVTADLALACGLGVALVGVAILAGLLRSSTRRLSILEADRRQGTIAARPRVLSEMSRRLAEQAEGATDIRPPTVSLSRGGRRGELSLRGARLPEADARTVRTALADAVSPITIPFKLRARIRTRTAEGRARVR